MRIWSLWCLLQADLFYNCKQQNMFVPWGCFSFAEYVATDKDDKLQFNISSDDKNDILDVFFLFVCFKVCILLFDVYR